MPQAWIIERLQRQNPATAWKVVLWADVTVPERRRYYAKPATWTSAYWDATAPQLADLRAGVMTEMVVTLSYSDTVLFGDVRQDIEAELTRFQNLTNNLNLWNRYGTGFNGTTWTITDNP